MELFHPRPGTVTLFEVARELGQRLTSIFVPDATGRRPVYGGTERIHQDPNWKDLVLFYEYFHGDNGAGLGASHQTGWTGLVARVIQGLGYFQPEDLLSNAIQGQLVYAMERQPTADKPTEAKPNGARKARNRKEAKRR